MPAPRVLSRLVHLLLPPLCAHCDEPLPDARPGVCRWCRATLRPLGPGCRRCSLPRPGEPAEVARAILWLLSDEASYMTGALVDVTGGR